MTNYVVLLQGLCGRSVPVIWWERGFLKHTLDIVKRRRGDDGNWTVCTRIHSHAVRNFEVFEPNCSTFYRIS